jgi:hypothetical protein
MSMASFASSSFTDRLDSHVENVDFALESVAVTAVTVFLAVGVLFIDLKIHTQLVVVPFS